MFLRNCLRPCLYSLVIFCALFSWSAYSQQNDSASQAQGETTIEGTVVSSSRVTFVVRSDDNQFHLFTFDRSATRPRTLPVGTRVRVVSDEGDQQGARNATDVTVLEQAQGASSANASARHAAPL